MLFLLPKGEAGRPLATGARALPLAKAEAWPNGSVTAGHSGLFGLPAFPCSRRSSSHPRRIVPTALRC
ncbi:hypothetical protein B1812_03005 [Methylocystis bryophila]|uniref:Uncharacterized protein n=1 Tax=Methylocystis bryophila TaxID=655015 RepID=A0A1W6MRN1_9HYPH|nr:hypothetical protein B1812_03005 [Methylocystis bryophila]